MPSRVPSLLVVAGVDPTGSAGLTQIVSAAKALMVFAAGVPSTLIIEDTGGVDYTHPVPLDVFNDMLEKAFNEVKPVVLASSVIPTIDHAKRLTRYGAETLHVHDVVWEATAGGFLVKNSPREILRTITRSVDILVVNAIEAERLTGIRVTDLSTGVKACKALITGFGVDAVVLKGGHKLGCVDMLVERDSTSITYRGPCIPGVYHGSGCVYLGAFTALLASGLNIDKSFELAQEFVRASLRLHMEGSRQKLVTPDATFWVAQVLNDVKEALDMLVSSWELVSRHVPEVGINVISAMPYVRLWAGVEGRVRRTPDNTPVYGNVKLFSSSHLARLLSTLHSKGITWVLGAVNIRFDERVVDNAAKNGYIVSFYDRRLEPPHVRAVEGASIPWGVSQALKEAEPLVPDIIYHRGDVGKEPMIVFLGLDAKDAVKKLLNTLSTL